MKALDNSSYRIFTGKSEAHKAFNSLRGIIEGIAMDTNINPKEIEELEKWCSKHEFLVNKNPFNDLIINIEAIIHDNIVTEDEIKDMLWLCDKLKTGLSITKSSPLNFKYYREFVMEY
jgi:hypothetical protein